MSADVSEPTVELRVVVVAVVLVWLLWLVLVPLRFLIAGRGLAPIIVAPWLAGYPHWIPGDFSTMGPGLGSGLTGWTLQHPILTARILVRRARQQAKQAWTVSGLRLAAHTWLELETRPPTHDGAPTQ